MPMVQSAPLFKKGGRTKNYTLADSPIIPVLFRKTGADTTGEILEPARVFSAPVDAESVDVDAVDLLALTRYSNANGFGCKEILYIWVR